MLLIDSPVAFLLGTIALAMAAPFVAAAALEDARSPGWPLPVVAFAGLWSLVFVTSAALVAHQGELAAAGLLGAAAELSAAAVVWGLRCRRAARDDDDDGGRGPHNDDALQVGPSDGDAVDWQLLERQFDAR